MIPTYGIIKFYDGNGNLVWERRYSNFPMRKYLIGVFLERDVEDGYYQIAPGYMNRGNRNNLDKPFPSLRIKGVYSNQKSLYEK